MQKRVFKNKKNRLGYMLIEAVIATFIVGIVLVTFLTVMAASYRTEFSKRDIIIASNLAQEGIEIVRNIRDNNWKTCINGTVPCPANKSAFDSPFPGNGSGFCVFYSSDFSSIAPTATCGATTLCRNNTTGFYSNACGAGTTVTTFRRNITLVNGPSTPATDSRIITSTVTWGTTSNKTLTMTDTIYSWGNTE
ncbi:MAG: hypothetical protein WAX81_00395 [Candidatus Moraniibacteriota bacterium]